MKDKVFIAWSGEHSRAETIRQKLKALKFDAVIGGNVNEEAENVFVGQTVISQMRSCAQAIFLIQTKSDGTISSNLLFEFGYLLNKLQFDKIHAFFLDIKENDAKIPSDIRGVWADYLSTATEEDVNEKMVKLFMGRQFQIIKDDKLNIIVNRYYYTNLIKNYLTAPQITEYELAQYLLFYPQVIYFNGQDEESETIINSFFQSYHHYSDELQIALMFCKTSMEFYNVFFSKENNVLSEHEAYTKIYKYEELLERVENLPETEFQIWLFAFIYEHLGFVLYYYLLSSQEDVLKKIEQYKKIIQYNQCALRYLNELSDGKYASGENLYFSTLFKAYVYRQKAISHKNIFLYTHSPEDAKEGERCFVNSFKMRKILYNSFPNMRANEKVLGNMELDYYLSMSEIIEFEEFSAKRERYKTELKNYLKKQKNKRDVIAQHILYIENNLCKGGM